MSVPVLGRWRSPRADAEDAVVLRAGRASAVAIAGGQVQGAVRARRHVAQPPVFVPIELLLVDHPVRLLRIEAEPVQVIPAERGEEEAPAPLGDRVAAVEDRTG